jgi:BlaI family transcriptional regulator, penicillinase repressor
MPAKPPLSSLEQKIMEILWSAENATASSIQAALEPDRPLRDSTVRTVLTRLEEKGYVEHAIDGRTFVYSSVEPPQNLAVRAVKQILDRFCKGSVESLLTGMVNQEIVNPKELQKIADRLAVAKSPEKKRRRK